MLGRLDRDRAGHDGANGTTRERVDNEVMTVEMLTGQRDVEVSFGDRTRVG